MTATEDAATRDTSTGSPSWIAQLLRFDRDGDTFVASNALRGPSSRLFGGMIAAQALGAAGATVDADKHPQSLHLYFVRGGRYGVDVDLHVDRTRTGRSFDTRRVTAVQDGQVILEMIASFHRLESSADWHPDGALPLALAGALPKQPAIELADYFEFRTSPDDSSAFALPPFWIRVRDPIEDDPLLRACTLVFLSDIGPVPAARPPDTPMKLGLGFTTSLDHSVWFHRPFAPQRWHCYDVQSVNHSGARGLVAGSLYDEAGSLIASTSQQALWRL